ncbi:MAG: hypothetical protein AVDCRST_MAG32-3073, partial [uncultured Nocardioides sp.]
EPGRSSRCLLGRRVRAGPGRGGPGGRCHPDRRDHRRGAGRSADDVLRPGLRGALPGARRPGPPRGLLDGRPAAATADARRLHVPRDHRARHDRRPAGQHRPGGRVRGGPPQRGAARGLHPVPGLPGLAGAPRGARGPGL